MSAIAQDGETLARRGFMGIRFAPLADSIAAAQGVSPNSGVLILGVLPNSSAEAAGLRSGDIVTGIDGHPVRALNDVFAVLSDTREGTRLRIKLMRRGKPMEQSMTVKAFPREEYPGVEVRYDQVRASGGLLRTIITRPEGAGEKLPAVFIIQGIDCGSIDQPMEPDGHYARMVRYLSERGYATFRVEKSGVGDSRGTPCANVDFTTETDGFLQGLRALREYEFVDPERIYLVGFSMGGVWAPAIAAQESVAGIVVYGTIGRPFHEYMQENGRRQGILADRDFVEIEQEARNVTALMHYLGREGLSPDQIVEQHPQLAAETLLQGAEPLTNPEHLYAGRHYTFFQQLCRLNLSEQWKGSDAPVLAVWGRGDFVSAREDHTLIVELVNAYRPGTAKFVAIDADHWMQQAAGQEEGFRNRREGTPAPYQEMFLQVLGEWLAERS